MLPEAHSLSSLHSAKAMMVGESAFTRSCLAVTTAMPSGTSVCVPVFLQSQWAFLGKESAHKYKEMRSVGWLLAANHETSLRDIQLASIIRWSHSKTTY